MNAIEQSLTSPCSSATSTKSRLGCSDQGKRIQTHWNINKEIFFLWAFAVVDHHDDLSEILCALRTLLISYFGIAFLILFGFILEAQTIGCADEIPLQNVGKHDARPPDILFIDLFCLSKSYIGVVQITCNVIEESDEIACKGIFLISVFSLFFIAQHVQAMVNSSSFD